ncbi:MAG: hypothetical protein NNA20_01475 [Nitrospira sp.]|nr:hypothetical protein [Nitrospira sp.]MCP9441239.1 hypothetical protein [Nitrospira sp.]
MKRTRSVEPFTYVFPIGDMARLMPVFVGFVICSRIKSLGKTLSKHTFGRSAIVISPFLTDVEVFANWRIKEAPTQGT